MASEGDLIIPLKTTDGKVIAFQAGKSTSDGDVVIPAIGTDGKVVSVKVNPMVSEDEVGLGVQGVDGLVVPVTFSAGVLYLGGSFLSTDGDVFARRIAVLNEAADTFGIVGNGLTFNAGCEALLSHSSGFYAAGDFTANVTSSILYDRIAKFNFDSGDFEEIGNGLAGNANGLGIHTVSSQIVVVGIFANAGGVADTFHVAGYDPDSDTFFTLGGTPTVFTSGQIFRPIVFQSSLYVVGAFGKNKTDPPVNNRIMSIAKFDGVTWNPLHPVDNQTDFATVDTLRWAVEFAGKLHFGGGQDRVRTWDGSNYGTILTMSNQNTEDGVVYKGDLIIGGTFSTEFIGGLPTTKNVARWDGNNLFPMGSGALPGLNFSVLGLHVFKGTLYATGAFTADGNGTLMEKIARFDDETQEWIPGTSGVGVEFGNGFVLETHTK